MLAPLVPTLVDAVYDKLFGYDSTKRHFVPKQSGYEGEAPADIDSLTLDHPMIAFRKKHLGKYLESLVTREYDSSMVAYLDMVGKIHTPKAGSKDLDIPLVADLPGVGQNLRDHMTAEMHWHLKSTYIPESNKHEHQVGLRYTAQDSDLFNDMIVYFGGS